MPENIEEVRSVIDDDSYITIEKMEMQTNLSHGTIQRVVSDHLNLRKITALYMPKYLTDSQRAERVRIYEENLTKFEDETW
ncbi:unnamed protein product [Adineta ricciae]|uniref:Uncharacterized protein n=1 Tax=Adineta ricciae TaxID=249248 RepID=A0A814ZPN5_ADIRI|nr:unnamed protein product [Adineta ricciae]CAF1438055.1 unnamed protein product [Adineta ricciae]